MERKRLFFCLYLLPLLVGVVKVHSKHVARKEVSVRDEIASMRYPGTLWCGKGFRAEKISELGAFSATDNCCRQHDLQCPISLGPLESKFGITNWRTYTTMHCSCDDRFRACLKMARSPNAQKVGTVFFNIIQTPCFTVEKTEVCAQRNWWGSCVRYEKRLQGRWRDALPF